MMIDYLNVQFRRSFGRTRADLLR